MQKIIKPWLETFQLKLMPGDEALAAKLGRKIGETLGPWPMAKTLRADLMEAMETAEEVILTPPAPPSFESLKQQKIQQIDARTSELVKYGFAYSTSRFSMSDAAQRNWLGLATMVGFKANTGADADAVAAATALTGGSFPVSDINEGHLFLTTKADFDAFIGAYLNYQTDPNQPLHQGRVLRAQASAATTQEELDAVVDDRTAPEAI